MATNSVQQSNEKWWPSQWNWPYWQLQVREKVVCQSCELLTFSSSSTVFKLGVSVRLQRDEVTNATVGCVVLIFHQFYDKLWLSQDESHHMCVSLQHYSTGRQTWTHYLNVSVTSSVTVNFNSACLHVLSCKLRICFFYVGCSLNLQWISWGAQSHGIVLRMTY